MTPTGVDWSFLSVIDYVGRAGSGDRTADERPWEALMQRLQEAVRRVTDSPLTAAAVDRASAYRGLLQLLHFGLERTLGLADPYRPVLSRPWAVHLFDYGAGNPDAVYHTAAVRDDVTYRISGQRGNADFLSFELFAGTQQAGSISTADLQAAPDGTFEVLFGPVKRDRNWLEVVPGTSSLLSREFFGDWAAAEPGRYQIECLDPAPLGWPSLAADRVEREIEALGDWLVAALDIFMGAQARGLDNYRNAFDPRITRPESGLPAIYHAFWDLAPDECVVLEAAPPVGGYWSIQLANSLWNTLDFANRQTSLNLGQVDRETDGSIRLVLAHSDPGVANWLDTMGLTQGALTLRFTYPEDGTSARRPEPTLASTRSDWMAHWEDKPDAVDGSGIYPSPVMRVMRMSELATALPTGTRRVSADERRQVIDRRLKQVTRLISGC